MNKGDGTFTTMPSVPVASDGVGSLAVGDFNGDGNVDVAVGDTFRGTVTILLGNGDGTFHQDDDGIADLAMVDPWSQTLRIALGKGDGTFTVQAAHPSTGVNPLDIAVGDFNGDGKVDLVVCNAFGPDYS